MIKKNYVIKIASVFDFTSGLSGFSRLESYPFLGPAIRSIYCEIKLTDMSGENHLPYRDATA